MENWIDTPNSSNIEGFGYDTDEKTLTIRFKSGVEYDYYDVPPYVAGELEDQKKLGYSVGKYFVKNIRNNYQFYRR